MCQYNQRIGMLLLKASLSSWHRQATEGGVLSHTVKILLLDGPQKEPVVETWTLNFEVKS